MIEHDAGILRTHEADHGIGSKVDVVIEKIAIGPKVRKKTIVIHLIFPKTSMSDTDGGATASGAADHYPSDQGPHLGQFAIVVMIDAVVIADALDLSALVCLATLHLRDETPVAIAGAGHRDVTKVEDLRHDAIVIAVVMGVRTILLDMHLWQMMQQHELGSSAMRMVIQGDRINTNRRLRHRSHRRRMQGEELVARQGNPRQANTVPRNKVLDPLVMMIR